mmetsp:Transcript_13938/g.42055  ORF Transcript_13938/g.42055 Transcript_13938/m.42055 type:complete len:202 (+) Transcript_13938:64-669(+)
MTHLNLTQRQESWVVLDGLANELRTLSLSLCPDDGTLLVLLCFVDHKLGALCILLSDLFGLNRGSVVAAESEVGDGHIIQDNVEEVRPLRQDAANVPADYLTHCEQLAGIVLCNHALQRFLNDGGQHTLPIVSAQRPVNFRQLVWHRPSQHSQPDVDHLQVAGPGSALNDVGARPHVVNNGSLKPRDHNVSSFLVHRVLDP